MDTVEDSHSSHKAEQIPTSTDKILAMPEPAMPGLTEVLSDSEQSLETVRSILFGRQMRDMEKKQLVLERFIRVSMNTLSEETQNKINGLKNELSLLTDLVSEEGQQRRAAVVIAQERFTSLEKNLDRLGQQVRADDHELQQRLTLETRKLDQQMNDWRSDLLAQLEQASAELHHQKADRKSVAALLQGMAQQLSDEAGTESV